MQFKLVVVAGAAKTQEIRLRLPAVLGRGRACSVQLPHPLVSRQHCEVFEAENKLVVRDLGSLNGTLVDGQKITEAEIRLGQQLTIGSLTFRLELANAATETAPRRRPPVTTTATVPTPGAAATLRAPTTTTPTGGAVTSPTPPVPPLPQAVPMAAANAAAGPPATSSGAAFEPAPLPLDDKDEPLADFAELATQDAPRSEVVPPSAIASPAESAPVAFEAPDSFLADESPGEDAVEVVEDAADLLPPSASPSPTAPFVPNGSEPTTVMPSASPVPPAMTIPSSVAPPAPLATPTQQAPAQQAPAQQAPAQQAPEEDEDLAAFLRSLGR